MRDYPLQFIVFFAEVWAVLRGQALSETERRRLTLFAGAGCLYDDFFDENQIPTEDVYQIVASPLTYPAQTDKERLCAELLTDLYVLLPERKHFSATFEHFYQAQLASQQQIKNVLPAEELWKISADKGGYALLLSFWLLDQPTQHGEPEAVYQLGAWFQLLDDLLDIDKDYKKGITTLLTSTSDMRLIARKLQEETQQLFKALRTLPYSATSVRKVIRLFRIIGTSGQIHLRQLLRLQSATQGIFDISKYPSTQIQWVETKTTHLWVGLWYLIFTSKPA
jgi:hypothetical protein